MQICLTSPFSEAAGGLTLHFCPKSGHESISAIILETHLADLITAMLPHVNANADELAVMQKFVASTKKPSNRTPSPRCLTPRLPTRADSPNGTCSVECRRELTLQDLQDRNDPNDTRRFARTLSHRASPRPKVRQIVRGFRLTEETGSSLPAGSALAVARVRSDGHRADPCFTGNPSTQSRALAVELDTYYGSRWPSSPEPCA